MKPAFLLATFVAPVFMSLLTSTAAAACPEAPRISERMVNGAHGRYELVTLPGEKAPAVRDLGTGRVWKICEEGLVWWSPDPRIPGSCVVPPTANTSARSVPISVGLAADYGAWRLPTRDELESLLEKTGSGPTDAQIDPIFGPDTSAQTFLSSSLCSFHTNASPESPTVTTAGVVDFQKGVLGWEPTAPAFPGRVFVRLVHR